VIIRLMMSTEMSVLYYRTYQRYIHINKLQRLIISDVECSPTGDKGKGGDEDEI
jgi:hypothetical protein